MAIPLANRQPRQPRYPVTVDTANPITRGLVRALVCEAAGIRDLMLGTGIDVTGTYIPQATEYGYGRRNNTITRANYTTVDARTETVTAITIVWAGVVHRIGGATYPFFRNQQTIVQATSSTGPLWSVRFGVATTVNSTTPIKIGAPTTYVYRKDGAIGSLFVDGAPALLNITGGTGAHAAAHGIDGNIGFAQSNDITTNVMLIYDRPLSDAESRSLSINPWQVFRPLQRRIYFDLGSITPPSDHILTAESAIQQILSEVGSVAQENTLVGGISVQSAVSSNGVIQQTNALIGENSFSNNLSAVASLAQLNILRGNDQQTVNLSSDSSVSQIHNLSALSSAVEIVSSSAGILQSNILLASSCLVPNYSASGSIALVPVTDLSGNSVSQYDLSSSSSLLQEHVLTQNASEQSVLSSSDVVVQSHVLISDNSTQIVLSSSGAIGTSGSLLGNNAQQTNASSSGFIIQASFLQGNVVKQLNLSSSGAITQGGELPPLTDAEIRQMFAMLQVAVAKLQTRIDAVL